MEQPIYMQGVGDYGSFSAGPFVSPPMNYADRGGSAYQPQFGADPAPDGQTAILPTNSTANPLANWLGPPSSAIQLAYRIFAMAGTGIGAYHGYKRNDSIGWAIVWAVLGGALPIIVIPVALAQGLGKQKYKTTMVANKRRIAR